MPAGTDAITVVVEGQLMPSSDTLPNEAVQPGWKFCPVMVTATVAVLTQVLGAMASTIGRGTAGVEVGSGVSVGIEVGGTGVDVAVGVDVLGDVAVGVGVAGDIAVGVPVAVPIAVTVGTIVLVDVGLRTLVALGEGKTVGTDVGLAAATGEAVATGSAVGLGVGVRVGVGVGVGGKSTIAMGVCLTPTGVLASRATSVAASAPTPGFNGANRVLSLETRP
jgi:hypothetical protein